VSAFYAISNNRSGRAKKTIFELAGGIGIAKKRLIKTSFEHEAIGDLFGEQAVLCGGLAGLVKSGFDILVKKGIPPDNAYLEVAYQLDLIVELIKQHGLEGMLKRISVAARMGAVEAAPFLIDHTVKSRMETLANRVVSGEFAARLSRLTESDMKRLNRSTKSLTNPAFEKAAKKFRR
jgi:ketol-acid reductoisomerase